MIYIQNSPSHGAAFHVVFTRGLLITAWLPTRLSSFQPDPGKANGLSNHTIQTRIKLLRNFGVGHGQIHAEYAHRLQYGTKGR